MGIKYCLVKWWFLFIYKPDTKEIYWGKIVPAGILVLGFILIVLFNNGRLDKQKAERMQFARYAIGITTDQHKNVRGGLVVDYYFTFLNSKYKNSESTKNSFFGRPNTHGGRYYVMFASTNPSNSELLFENPVPSIVLRAPDSGWSYMPGYENN